MSISSTEHIELEDSLGAHNYHPLDVVIAEAEGCWVTDVEGRRYLDCLSAYSALNHGHRHPKIIAALQEQAARLTLTSRAFRHDQLSLFYRELCAISGMRMALPMNTGAEAVETAIKAARKWGYLKKGIPDGEAEIIVCNNNFHGRTITVISFSTEEQYRAHFGPLTPGFRAVEFGDIDELASAISPRTCAFLVEPIQGEAGVRLAPDGYLAQAAALCREHQVLFIADEIQTGLGRTGKLFAVEHEGVEPDLLVLGKALGGGVYPVSAVLARNDVLEVFRPGDHGSTFGGNPLACRVARAALEVLIEERLPERADEIGRYFLTKLGEVRHPDLLEVRGKGLMIGMEFSTPVRAHCEALMHEGILCKETHGTVIRFTPPLTITKEEIDWLLERVHRVLAP